MSNIGSGSTKSLFAAFSQEAQTTDVQAGSTHSAAGWLQNSTFTTADAVRIQHIHQKSDNREASTEDEKSTKPAIDGRLYVSSSESMSDESISSSEHRIKRKKTKKKKKKKHKKHKHQSSREDDFDRSDVADRKDTEAIVKPPTNAVFSEEVPGVETFRIDKSSDTNNFIYKSLYKVNIARYYPGTKFIIGDPHRATMKNERKKVKASRYYRPASRRDTEVERLFTQPGETPNLTEEFLALNDQDFHDPDKMEKELQIDPLKIYDKSTQQYIQGIKMSHPANANAPQSTVSQEELKALSLKQKTEDFNRRLRQQPHDIVLWLEFIRFQEEFIQSGTDLNCHLTSKELSIKKREESLLIQTKEAIFERALKENPSNPILSIEHLQFCQDYWDVEKLTKSWHELLFKHPSNLQVWTQYLTFIESRVGNFTVTKQIKDYRKCLTVLKKTLEKEVPSKESDDSIVNFLIGVFARLCVRLRESGHMEKGVGLYQALLEYNLFQPDSMALMSDSQRMEFFVAFWESSAARLGESGAGGWGDWVIRKGAVSPGTPLLSKEEDASVEEEALQTKKDKFSLWLTLESARASTHWLPWRPDALDGGTEDDCEDPERIILADDVTFAIFQVTTQHQRYKVLQNFLELLGAPSSISECHELGMDHLSSYGLLHQITDFLDSDVVRHCENSLLYKSGNFVGNIIKQTLPLFTKEKVLQTDLIEMYVDFLEHQLRWIKQNSPPLRFVQAVKDTRLCMKKLLKENVCRGSVFAWLRFAQLEFKVGKLDEARKVLNNVIGTMVPDLTNITDSLDLCIACHTYRRYAEIEMGLHKPTLTMDSETLSHSSVRASHILSQACDSNFIFPSENISLSPIQTLKCRRHYDRTLARLTEDIDEPVQKLGTAVEHWAVCYLLFTYLVSGMPTATDLFQSISKQLGTQHISDAEVSYKEKSKVLTVVRERITEAYINLLQYHSQRHRTPLRLLRDPLKLAMQEFPENVQLLKMYIQLELNSTFSGQLRKYLAARCRDSKSPVMWLLVVLTELAKIQKLQDYHENAVPEDPTRLPQVGLLQVVRAWLDRATTTATCGRNVLLWHLYLQFEMKYGKVDSTKAVFYRGLQHCPWAKCLYVDYMKSCPAALQDTTDLLVEKGLRLHTPTEEIDILLEDSDMP